MPTPTSTWYVFAWGPQFERRGCLWLEGALPTSSLVGLALAMAGRERCAVWLRDVPHLWLCSLGDEEQGTELHAPAPRAVPHAGAPSSPQHAVRCPDGDADQDPASRRAHEPRGP